VSIQLATVDPTELGELVVEAWRQTAPKRLVVAYDADQDTPAWGSEAPGSGR
jgi:hypothetical protein